MTGKENLTRGYVQIYTGNSKGKTTAALGIAFRALGWGLKTYIGQFMKGQLYGELEAAKIVSPYITMEQYGKDTFIHIQDPADPVDINMAKEGLAKARAATLSGKYDIIVLDEIITAHYFHLLAIDDLLGMIKDKLEKQELIMTGRYAPQELIQAADLVTEMVEIKHYFNAGVAARKGIEY